MSSGGVAKVAIGYCHPDKVSSFFHASIINLLQRHQKQVVSVIGVLSGPKVDTARNNIVRNFLNTSADYLLMVDTDMVLPPNTLSRLLEAKKDIVGGLCFSGSFTGAKVVPAVRVLQDEGEGQKSLVPLWEYPKDQLVQVAGTGAACVLIHKRVFKATLKIRGEDHPMPWYAHGLHNGIEIGEDIGFCLTARVAGFETWVDTGLIIRHVKPRFIAEWEYVESLKQEDHPYYNQRESVPIYQELINGHTSVDGNRQGDKEL